MDKPFWQSKTLWLNILSLVVVVLTATIDTDLVKQNPELVLAFMAVVNVLNAVLRFLTKVPVTIVVLLLGLFAAAASAADVAIVVDDAKPATYLVTVGADGIVSVSPLRVIRPGSPTNPTNPPPTNPPPGNTLQARAQSLTTAALAEGGSHSTASKLAAVYSFAADQSAAGRLPPASISPALVELSDGVIPAAEKDTWAKWRKGVGALLIGRIATKEDATATLRAVSEGTQSAVNGSALAAGERALDWQELFKMLLPLFLKLIEKWLIPAAM